MRDEIEHEEILAMFRQFREVRSVFAKYEGKWFSGNDNHVGDIGEYWAMRYFEAKGPHLAPKRTSDYDIELGDGTRLSVKTMSKWNKRGRGGRIKGIDESRWKYLVAIKLDDNFQVEEFYIVPREEVKKRINKSAIFNWGPWLTDFRVLFS